MSLKTTVLMVAISIACIVFLFLYPVLLSTTSSSGENCIILTVDESQDDSLIRETLSSGGLGDFISESSQFVAVDDFGSLKYIALDSFKNEIEEFDPRDDGYARKIGSFFVHEGKRFFFRLINPESGERAGKIKKEAGALLENIPFTFVVLGTQGFDFLYLPLLIVAFFLAVFASRYRRLFIFQFPALMIFSLYGFYSLILAAILTGIWELLREPLGELAAAFHYKRRFRDYAGAGLRGIIERLKPFRVNLLLVLFFLVLMAAFSFFGIVPLIVLTVVFIIFIFLYFLSLKVETERARKNRHILFIPVLMLPRKVKTFSFFPLLLPFALISLIALFLPQTTPVLNSPIDPSYLISQEEYERHMAFQSSFSYRPMYNDQTSFQALNQTEYLRYYLGDDGLIAGSIENRDENGLSETGQSFPLEKLMDFLIKYNKPAVGRNEIVSETVKDGKGISQVKEFLAVGIILSFCLLDLLRPLVLSKKNIPVYGDKRIAA